MEIFEILEIHFSIFEQLPVKSIVSMIEFINAGKCYKVDPLSGFTYLLTGSGNRIQLLVCLYKLCALYI